MVTSLSIKQVNILPFLTVTASIIFTMMNDVWLSKGLIIISLSLGLHTKIVNIIGICFLLLISSLIILKDISNTLIFFIMLFGFAITLHKIPGFSRYIFIKKQEPFSQSNSFECQFDKAIFAAILLTAINNHQTVSINSYLFAFLDTIFGFSLLIGLAIGFGAKFNPKNTSFNKEWFFLNSLSSLSEEIFFRGFLQNEFSAFFQSDTLSIFAASLIFGIAHYPKGLLFIVFATLAGIMYGTAYYLTGNIMIATLIHILLNYCHRHFFIFPGLKR